MALTDDIGLRDPLTLKDGLLDDDRDIMLVTLLLGEPVVDRDISVTLLRGLLVVDRVIVTLTVPVILARFVTLLVALAEGVEVEEALPLTLELLENKGDEEDSAVWLWVATGDGEIVAFDVADGERELSALALRLTVGERESDGDDVIDEQLDAEEENVASSVAFALLVDETDTLLLPVTLWLASRDRVPVAQPLEDKESVAELDPLALLVDDCDIDSVELPLRLFFAEFDGETLVLVLRLDSDEGDTVISEVDDAVCENPIVERGLLVVVRELCQLSLDIQVGDILAVSVISLEAAGLADTDEVDDDERLANEVPVGAFAVALVDGVAVTDNVEFGDPLADAEGDRDPVTVLDDERDCVPLTVGE